MTNKYRYRLCNGWDIYPDKNPEDLTLEEVYNGLIAYRGKDGNNRIYFFRYAPTEKLGPRMKNTLRYKTIIRIDIDDPKTIKYIKNIDWGFYNSNGDNEKLTRDYYDNISEQDYFSNYDDNAVMNFAALNHISISPVDGYLPKRILTIL
jgi:hypothetical protein